MIMIAPQDEPAPGNIKVTRWDWINLALQTLISDGIESVRVLPLGQKLGVSRSSFYWYFESRQDLLDQLLAHWRDTNTRALVERAQRPAESIIMGVMNVFECWADERLFDPRLDFAIRECLGAIRDMYRRHGYDDEDAFIRARVLYYMQIGYYVLDLKEPVEARVSHLAAYLRSFTGQEPSDAHVAHFMRFIAAR
ncbi:TetR/AcrR family transcriptional regulator [Mesorhizobium sp.]|uniref:TetR/AcrR family transcriptional regulator n=1 Tax=Mesorhizobium sp. TaxID=1871066 RepID=UPI001200F4B3|nr:TetR/AcrR family transcriptional regulator [Mesorhizobium sp.]TIM54651.1 MAG: TetR/AcrR family transcriptional regulator [Mesorhizobium sp.]